MPDLTGRRVLITGASSGVGFATAERFALAGADVALLARGADGLNAAAERVRAAGRTAHVIPVDVADRPALELAVAEAVDRLGGLDIAVVNAASMVFGLFSEVSPEQFERSVSITMMGAIDTIRAVRGPLEQSAGVLVVVGSLMTTVPLPTFSSYAASKHGLRGFMESLRVELRSEGSPMRTAMLHPGPVDTPLWASVTSGNGHQPRRPPDLYSADVMARAAVALAAEPRLNFTVGGEGRLVELGWLLARPLVRVVLGLVLGWYASSDRPSRRPGGLWEAQGAGTDKGDGLWGRPSLWAALRLGRAYRDQGPWWRPGIVRSRRGRARWRR